MRKGVEGEDKGIREKIHKKIFIQHTIMHQSTQLAGLNNQDDLRKSGFDLASASASYFSFSRLDFQRTMKLPFPSLLFPIHGNPHTPFRF